MTSSKMSLYCKRIYQGLTLAELSFEKQFCAELKAEAGKAHHRKLLFCTFASQSIENDRGKQHFITIW
jgi:hypothetical protein